MGTRTKTTAKNGERPRHFIREWRKHRGFTQEQLASRLEVAVSTISQLETGKQGYSQPTLEAIAEALSCQPADLLIRNPLVEDAVWSIEDQLKRADPAKRETILAVMETILKAG